MTKDFWEHTSIVLNTISFFLVTIDLYGKERLQNLRTLLKADPDPDLFNFKNNTAYGKLVEAIMPTNILCLIISLVVLIFSIFDKTSDGPLFKWTGNNILDYLISLLVIPLSSSIMLGFIILVLFIWMYALYFLFKLIAGMSKIFPIEGMMLLIGALMFIISQIISYKNV